MFVAFELQISFLWEKASEQYNNRIIEGPVGCRSRYSFPWLIEFWPDFCCKQRMLLATSLKATVTTVLLIVMINVSPKMRGKKKNWIAEVAFGFNDCPIAKFSARPNAGEQVPGGQTSCSECYESFSDERFVREHFCSGTLDKRTTFGRWRMLLLYCETVPKRLVTFHMVATLFNHRQ